MELCKTLQRELPQGIRQPWIWHGFRGSPQQADQFLALREKNYLSFGERFNPAAAAAVNPGRMLVETDEADIPLSRVVDNVADALSTDAFSLSGIIQAKSEPHFPGNMSNRLPSAIASVMRMKAFYGGVTGSGTGWATGR